MTTAADIMNKYAAPVATPAISEPVPAARRNSSGGAKSKSLGAKAGAPSASKMSEEQLRDLRQIFDWLDVSGDAQVSIDEMLIALSSIDPSSTRADAEALIREATGAKGADKIGWDDFCRVIEKGMTQGASAAQMFELLDTRGVGQLGPDALRAALTKYGGDASDGAIDKMVRYADANADGQVSLQEFADALARQPGVEVPAI